MYPGSLVLVQISEIQYILGQDRPGEEMATHSVFLHWKIHGQGTWWATIHRMREESDTTEVTWDEYGVH